MNRSLGYDVKVPSTPTFTKNTSELIGISESTIKHEMQIARDIVPEVHPLFLLLKEKQALSREKIFLNDTVSF